VDIKRLGRTDLNLLVALQVLLEERSVSKAAERLFVTQSAMSKTLRRLRELLDDPLFTRSSAGMLPTPRALELEPLLVQSLFDLDVLVTPRTFDAADCEDVFNVVMPEYVSYWLMPALMERLSRVAPKIRLMTSSQVERQLDLLACGELDFAVHLEYQDYAPEFNVRILGHAPPVLLARKGHPLEGKVVTWEHLLDYPQVLLSTPDVEATGITVQLESDFVRHEMDIQLALQTPHLFTALQVIKSTNYLLPGPSMLVEGGELGQQLIALPLPGGEEFMLKYVLVYHERIEHSPAHQFLLEQLLWVVEDDRKNRGLSPLAELSASI